MFENNGDMIPSEHLSHNNLWSDLSGILMKNIYIVRFLWLFLNYIFKM